MLLVVWRPSLICVVTISASAGSVTEIWNFWVKQQMSDAFNQQINAR
jgi:hypothetical protein